ncbi:hypothetical protein WMY93_009658 [Mugilogobius chulae]|uniref:Cadherin domain-containing protein n=1 Tax=Mugilogobius chulae TaxID=88201 RepID=A0AAW0PCC9_9GOBI
MKGLIMTVGTRYVLLAFSICLYVDRVSTSVTHYSIPEEMKEGSVVANLANDLRLDLRTLNERKMRLDIIANKKYLDVNKETGELYIVEKIDREYICPTKSLGSCYLRLEVILENPLRIFNIEVEIMDINDNAPHFRRDAIHLDISEATPKGERFSLSNAVDPDSPVSEDIDVDTVIAVVSNNAPGALLGSLTAFDPDLYENQYLVYFILEKEVANTSMSMLFSINPENGNFLDQYNGEIRTMRMFSYRDPRHQQLVVVAKDNGQPSLSATVTIKLSTVETAVKAYSDMTEVPLENSVVSERNSTIADSTLVSNDAYWYSLFLAETRKGKLVVRQPLPKGSRYIVSSLPRGTGVTDTSDSAASTLQTSVETILVRSVTMQSCQSEDIEVDTVIAVVSVSDKDSGDNGSVVSEPLDREKVPKYDITFTVTDRGSPPLSDNETMTLELLDVNDNVPQFPQSFYTIRVLENNAPGALLGSLTAFDPDLYENQYLVYFILEKEVANTSMSMLFSINPENGNLYALKTFDYEIEKEFLFHIEARDSGSPPLSMVEEKIPRSTDKGSLVAKVIALDIDSVHNSRITYQFLQVTDATLFSLDQYNGEIRTMRMFSYRDPRHQQLVVVAKDNGQPSLSATVTIKLSTVETAVKAYSDMTEVPLEYDIFSDLNLYLVIGLGSVSFLLLITILVTIVLKCQKPKSSNSTLVSNDAYWYSLFLAETRKGKLVVRQPLPKGSRYIVSSLPRGTGVTDTSDSAASTLQRQIWDWTLRPSKKTMRIDVVASIIVRVLDVNDNAPSFDEDKYVVNVLENSPIGSLVIKLNATDVDEGSNSDLVYSYSLYTSERTQNMFTLNPDNGEIRVKEMINYEDFKIYEWRSPAGSLTAFDPDLYENQYLVYFILEKEVANTSMSMLFSINPENGNFLDQYNGEIRTMRMFSYRDPRHQQLVVVAKDNGSPPCRPQ